MSDQTPENTPNYGQAPPQPGQPAPYPPPPGQPGAYPPAGQYPPGQYAYPPAYMPPKHPQATLAMVLGIVGLTSLMCYVTALVAPFAWWIGAKAVREIDANPTQYSGRGEAMAGKIMGIIGTVLLILGLLVIAGFIALLVLSSEFREGFENGFEDASILGAF